MRMGMSILMLALLGQFVFLPATARTGHHGGFGGHHGTGRGSTHGGAFASDRRHANGEHVKAAAEEEDRLLDSKVKSICRGC